MSNKKAASRGPVLNFAFLLAMALFFIALFPSGPWIRTPLAAVHVVATALALLTLAYASRMNSFSVQLVPPGTKLVDALIVFLTWIALGLVVFSRLTADLWSDAIYHASIASRPAQLLLYSLVGGDPETGTPGLEMNAGTFIRLVHSGIVIALLLIFFVVPRLLGNRPLAIALVWIAALIAGRVLFSTDLGLLKGSEGFPVLFANESMRDPHPPLRLLPLIISSAVFGTDAFGFRMAGYTGLLAAMWAFYFLLRTRLDRLNSAVGLIAIASLPGLLQTSALVEASIWPALAGWMTFAFFAASEDDNTPVACLVPLAVVTALAALMRAPGFIALAPLFLFCALAVSRRPQKTSDLVVLVGLMALAVTGALVFILFGTPAISEAPPSRQVLTALVGGIPAVALVTVMGLVPFFFLGHAIRIRSTHGAFLAAAVVGFLTLGILVFYGPTKSSLWGTPRYQAELATPILAAGLSAFLFSTRGKLPNLQWRQTEVLPNWARALLGLSPMGLVIAANLFALAAVDHNGARFLPHPTPPHTSSADALFDFRHAYSRARELSPGSTPYYIGYWYGGFPAVLQGDSTSQFALFSNVNERHRSGWSVNFDGVVSDRDIGALIVDNEADYGALQYFTDLHWEREDFPDPSSGLVMSVFNRPAGARGRAHLRDALPEMLPSMKEFIGQPMDEAFPKQMPGCTVHMEGVIEWIAGNAGEGVVLGGWGWHGNPSSQFDAVIAANSDGKIIGASGAPIGRADVAAAYPELGSDDVGFSVFVPVMSGSVNLYGVDQESGSRCPIATPYTIPSE